MEREFNTSAQKSMPEYIHSTGLLEIPREGGSGMTTPCSPSALRPLNVRSPSSSLAWTCWHDSDLENGDYVKVEGIKDEESKVKIKKEAALKLKREQKLKREEDVKRESVDSDIQPYSKFSNPALKRSREESEPPFVKKQKTSRSSPALSQIPSFDQEVIQLDLDSEDETFQMIRRSRSSSAPKEIIRLDLDSDDEDIQMIRRQRSESLGKFVRESAPSLSPSLSNNHRRRPVIDLDTEDQDDGMFVPMARRSIARTPTPN